MNQSFTDIILRVARDDGDYQAIMRLCRCEKAYLRALASGFKVEVKENTKHHLATAILSAMKKEAP